MLSAGIQMDALVRLNPDVAGQLYPRRHRGLWNLLFGDGHVKILKPRQAFD
ncbi:MAG: hypothetical protein KF833_15235 [Verrucomicrobiae bacterium]|nr:hypothetical protein [Verrucomicrobiae bacterium]